MPSMQMKVPVPGGEVTITGDSTKDIFRKAAFWQSLPTTCPIDNTPTKLVFRSPQDYEYYMLVSTGEFQYEFKLGIHNNAEQTLFAKDKWSYYDSDAREEKIVWEYGRVIEENMPTGATRSRPSPSTTSAPDPQDYNPAKQADEAVRTESDSERRLRNARRFIAQALEGAGVPDKMRGAVLTSMLGRPVGTSEPHWQLKDAKELKEYLDNIPDGVERAWEDVKASDPDAAAADGSDLDVPDEFFD